MTAMHRFAIVASLALLLAAIALFAVDLPQIAGPVLVVLFALAAFGVRGNEKLRGISFSLLIFAAVSFAMCWPAPLVSWGEFELSALIVPLLQIIMFGMGTAMSAADFVGVAKSPKAVFIGLACQFTFMPFVGAGLALAFDFGPEVAAGIILIGASPSGLASNVMAYIGKANLALSVTLTTVATLLAPFITPFYMQWLAGQYIPIDTWGMMWIIIQITILPIVAGLIFNHFLHGRTDWLDRLMPKVSMVGIALILSQALCQSAGHEPRTRRHEGQRT
jgi:BASS family bile acid:Na+ symporter